MTKSILGQVRSEGYRDGVSTMSQVAYDDGYEEGRKAGYREVTLGRGWYWLTGFLTGLGSMMLWGFFQ